MQVPDAEAHLARLCGDGSGAERGGGLAHSIHAKLRAGFRYEGPAVQGLVRRALLRHLETKDAEAKEACWEPIPPPPCAPSIRGRVGTCVSCVCLCALCACVCEKERV